MTEEFGKDIEKLENRIKENPDDLESMLKLGKTYFVCSHISNKIQKVIYNLSRTPIRIKRQNIKHHIIHIKSLSHQKRA